MYIVAIELVASNEHVSKRTEKCEVFTGAHQSRTKVILHLLVSVAQVVDEVPRVYLIIGVTSRTAGDGGVGGQAARSDERQELELPPPT